MIITISLVNVVISYSYQKKKEDEKCSFFLVMRTIRIYSLNNFSNMPYSIVSYSYHIVPYVLSPF